MVIPRVLQLWPEVLVFQQLLQPSWYLKVMRIASDIFHACSLYFLLFIGKIKRKGIVLPLTKDVYGPILQELKSYINPAIVESNPL